MPTRVLVGANNQPLDLQGNFATIRLSVSVCVCVSCCVPVLLPVCYAAATASLPCHGMSLAAASTARLVLAALFVQQLLLSARALSYFYI